MIRFGSRSEMENKTKNCKMVQFEDRPGVNDGLFEIRSDHEFYITEECILQVHSMIRSVIKHDLKSCVSLIILLRIRHDNCKDRSRN